MDVYTINKLRLLEVEFFGQGVWLRILISITSLTSIVASIFRLQVGPPFPYCSQWSSYQTFKSVLTLEVKKWNGKIVLFAFVVISKVEHIFLFYMPSLLPHPFLTFLLSWVFISICGHSSYTMKINPLSGMLLASVFSFTFWLYINQISAWQKHHKQSDLLIFNFMASGFYVLRPFSFKPENSSPTDSSTTQGFYFCL